MKRRHSLFDQEALEMLLKEKAKSDGLKYFFQKYRYSVQKQEGIQQESQEVVKTRYKLISGQCDALFFWQESLYRYTLLEILGFMLACVFP